MTDEFYSIIDKLLVLNFKFVVTGSVASIAFGEPRLTHDIDIVLSLEDHELSSLLGEFSEDEFMIPPLEILQQEIKRSSRGHFNIISYASGAKADIYLVGNERLLRWAVNNPKLLTINNLIIPFAPLEYVILKKLEFYREGNSQKHISDISSMLKISAQEIDQTLLNTLLQEKGLQELFENCFSKT
jgi:hypothetical protein